jgi:ribose transport system substrate-binding protein
MKGLRKVILAAVVASAAAVQLAGCGSTASSGSSGTSAVSKSAAAGTSSKSVAASTSSKSCRIGVSDGVSDSVEQSYLASIERAEAKRKGCELVLGTASGDPAQQFDQVQQWIEAKQVDAIVFLPTGGDPTALTKQAKAAGIPVVGYAGPLPGGTGAINYNNELAGEQLASAAVAWAKSHFPGNEIKDFSYGIFTFDACGTACTQRTDPIIAAMHKQLGVEPVSNQTAITEQTGLTAAQSMLSAHPNLSMILGIDDAGALGALKAVQAVGRTNKMFVGSIDGSPGGLHAVASGGAFKATAAEPFIAIGHSVIDLPAALIRTGKIPSVLLKSVLIDTPQKAEALLKVYNAAGAGG